MFSNVGSRPSAVRFAWAQCAKKCGHLVSHVLVELSASLGFELSECLMDIPDEWIGNRLMLEHSPHLPPLENTPTDYAHDALKKVFRTKVKHRKKRNKQRSADRAYIQKDGRKHSFNAL